MYLLPTYGQISTQHDIAAKDDLYSKSIIQHDGSLYFTFTSDSASITSTYIAKWDINVEKITWCKKISLERSVPIRPVKIVARKDNTFILGAYDFSWKDGFMNGNYTFIHFDKDGHITNSVRLGSPTGGQLRDLVLDDDDQILFLGDRINAQNAYRVVLGRLDHNLKILAMRSVFKDFYTYHLALQKDSKGNIYTVGHTQPVSSGTRRSMVTKWSKNLDHVNTLIQLDENPNSGFSKLLIDDKDNIHLGGKLSNLVKYVQLDENLVYKYGHEFNAGDVQNMWQDPNGDLNVFVGGVDYFVRMDSDNKVSFDAQYFNKGSITSQIYLPKDNRIISLSSYNDATDPKNRLSINSHTYRRDNECFLTNRSGDFNGPLRRDSFGITSVEIRVETMTAITPDDIIVKDYDITSKELCKIEVISSTSTLPSLDIQAYPNPAYDHVIIHSTSLDQNLTVELYNMSGSMIRQELDILNKGQLDISNLTAGLYLLKVYAQDGRSIVKKISVIK